MESTADRVMKLTREFVRWVRQLFGVRALAYFRAIEKGQATIGSLRVSQGEFPTLHVSGTYEAKVAGSLRVRLVGGRETITSDEVEVVGHSFDTVLPLTFSDRWGNSSLVLPSGFYRILLIDAQDGKEYEPQLSLSALRGTSGWDYGQLLNIRIDQGPRDVSEITIGPPLTKGETSRIPRRRANSRYRTHAYAPVDAVYFESFSGTRAACNPLALHDEIARRLPHLTRYWAVHDRSVAVPDGSVPIVIGSQAWRDVRGSASYIITNDRLPDFVHRPHQTYVQTWHGTPLKRLAMDRNDRDAGPEFDASIQQFSKMWDVLVSQNGFMTGAMRSAYGYEGEVLEVGYPRNDILLESTPARRREVRGLIGLEDHETALLYAPTWREDTNRKMPRLLDLDMLQSALGGDYRILVRGHAENIRNDNRLDGEKLIDVTTYPDVSELFLAADILITDYSSVMFDYAVTGKPILFFVPDLDLYSNARRGVYFDLGETSPGPLLATTEEVVDSILRIDGIHAEYAARYADWTARFNPHADGHAAARVVDAVFDARGDQ